jgi:DNA (cytosine-5)-methyltransferase 1
MEQIKVVDLFSGAGGMALGFEHEGFNTVLLNDIDKNSINTLKLNRPHWNAQLADIKTIDFTSYFGVDIVCGGFPCQPFSYAGNKLGLEDARGTVFFEFARAIKEIQPKVFIGENVTGLLTHDKGKTLTTILTILTNLGYNVKHEILNAYDFNTPQNRKRIIITGIRNDINTNIIYIPTNSKLTIKDALGNVPVSKGINYSKNKHSILSLIPMGGNWKNLPLELQKSYLGSSFNQGGGKTGIAKRLDWNKPSPTLTCSPSQKQTERCHPIETRPLTVREYARIQTFPDTWEFTGSVINQYKQIGNAVPVELAKCIAKAVKEGLKNAK